MRSRLKTWNDIVGHTIYPVTLGYVTTTLLFGNIVWLNPQIEPYTQISRETIFIRKL